MSKEELEELLDDVDCAINDALDPELTRVGIIRALKQAQELIEKRWADRFEDEEAEEKAIEDMLTELPREPTQ